MDKAFLLESEVLNMPLLICVSKETANTCRDTLNAIAYAYHNAVIDYSQKDGRIPTRTIANYTLELSKIFGKDALNEISKILKICEAESDTIAWDATNPLKIRVSGLLCKADIIEECVSSTDEKRNFVVNHVTT